MKISDNIAEGIPNRCVLK